MIEAIALGNAWLAALLLAAVWAGASLLMAALYAVQTRTRDAGIVDAGWAAGLGIAAAAYALAAPGDPMQRAALAAVACPWSARLAYYLLSDRVLRGGEDGRYRALRTAWGEAAPRRFFVFFQVQAALVALFSIPFLCAAAMPAFSPLRSAAALAAGWGAIAGEAIADRQLQRWRSDPAHRGKTCRAGLWGWSRHPNYFFEWLHWWAYVLLCAGAWNALPALLGPALMWLFLHRVTGIPYTERQALASRGDDYRAYQRSTSAFFPWPPRKAP